MPLPADPTQRAMVEDQLAFYKLQANGRKAAVEAKRWSRSAAATVRRRADATRRQRSPKAGKRKQAAAAKAGMDALGMAPATVEAEAQASRLPASAVCAATAGKRAA